MTSIFIFMAAILLLVIVLEIDVRRQSSADQCSEECEDVDFRDVAKG
jgi:hypothetical protein